MKSKEHEPKSLYVLHTTRVIHPPERTTESDEATARREGQKGMDSDESGAHKKGLSTTYLYPANT